MQISVTPFQGMVFNDFQGPSECHGHGLSAKGALSVEVRITLTNRGSQ